MKHYHFNIGEKGCVAFHVATLATKKEARNLLLDTLMSWTSYALWSSKKRRNRILALYNELVAEAEAMWAEEVLVGRDRSACDQLAIEYFACTCEHPMSVVP